MASGQEPTAPQIPQQDTAEGERVEVSMHRHPDGADGARPEHGALARRKYSLLAPKEPEGNPATAEPQGSGGRSKDTTGKGGTDRRETGMGKRNGQRAILTCGQLEDKDEERGLPEQQCALNTCIHQVEEGGGPPTHQRTLTARIQGMEGETPARPCTHPARSQETEEGGDPPHSCAQFLRASRG